MIPFSKVQATGNDFAVFDSRNISLRQFSPEKIRFLCDRHFGIGADGLIFIETENSGTMRMVYFNADGSEGEMCGNGLRAAARYAQQEGLFKENGVFGFEARDGFHQLWFNKDRTISVEILADSGKADAVDLGELPIPENLSLLGYFNSGVPHLILTTEMPIDEVPLLEFAPALRRHPAFKNGTNVNIIQPVDEECVKVRTYERGVEAETLSCGTGVTASALLIWQKYHHLPDTLQMQTKGGILKVSRQKSRIILTGPATIVFVGKIQF